MLSTKYDVITVGSATVDTFIKTDSSQTDILKIRDHKEIAYPLGAKILITDLTFFIGGGGTNTAVSFSRLGLKTAYLGKIGRDNNGKAIIDLLSKENVSFIGGYGDISGYSVVLDSVAEDRTIFAYKGCNDSLRLKDFKFEEIDTKWLYLSSMMKESFKTQKKIVSYAVKKGIKIAYNPSLYMVKEGSGPLKLILKHTDILILNKQEVQALVKDPTDNIYNLVFEASKLGPKIVIVTDGANGAHCYVSSEETVYSVKPKKVRIIETTGAGDAFASGFVAATIFGKDIVTSLKTGMINAESVIASLGPKNVLLGHNAFLIAEKDKRSVFKKKL